jgi:flagellar basal body-associated protein FliL
MANPTAVYASLSIISLGSLVGMAVAVGSGVSMMVMKMDEDEQLQKMTAASPAEKSFLPRFTRGFAASYPK